MRGLLLATLAASALIAGAGTTSAQTMSGSDHGKRGWTITPVAAVRDTTRRARNKHAKPRTSRAPRSDRMPASQEPMPQSPPGGY